MNIYNHKINKQQVINYSIIFFNSYICWNMYNFLQECQQFIQEAESSGFHDAMVNVGGGR